ncbi:ABC transporter substrate-binding protein [Paenibacillus sp. FA6]|uniref:ABC transporter substrate-binding protein n=1 Tax=Paenibacillus sp. FA6 TaxID=3413029 RepID=UPI003F65CDB4
MKRKMCGLLALVMVFTILAACGSKKENATTTADGVTTIEFWAANNPTQQAYWGGMADAYEQTNSKVKINVSVIKESPTSESFIQSAIAGGSGPTISENINRGFAAQLANSQALVPLDTLTGFSDIITTRNMEKTMEPWEFADGHQYVLPIYSNAMLFGWRLDLLKELGYNEPPKTYSQALEVNKKLKAKYPDKYFWAKAALADPTSHQRWFDFFMLYNAASGGNKFIEGDKFVADDTAGIETLQFVDDLRKDNGVLAQTVSDPFETGTGMFIDLGPWTFTNWAERFPELKYNENYTLSMPLVPDDIDPKDSKTFADTKGLVIYASATKEQQQAAIDFVKWVYSDPKNDAQWFDETMLPPARDDLTTNDAFKAILDENPQLIPYAENVSNAIPSIDSPKYNELQTFIGTEAWNKVVRGEIDPATGWANMKKVIEEELQ